MSLELLVHDFEILQIAKRGRNASTSVAQLRGVATVSNRAASAVPIRSRGPLRVVCDQTSTVVIDRGVL